MSRYVAPLGFTLAAVWVAVVFVLAGAVTDHHRPPGRTRHPVRPARHQQPDRLTALRPA